MNKRLEALIERMPTWPREAQEEAARILDAVEQVYVARESDAAKLAGLRELIENAISRGGSFNDEDVEAEISARLDRWERARA